jgi:Protein of unknown function (DUF3570)
MRMQLEPAKPPSTSVRDALQTAALALLLIPATAKAQSAPTDRVDFTSLLYGEQSRTAVIEPIVRFTHFLPDGQSISAQLGIDVITGASPTGALPSGTVQTRTSASGRVITSKAGQIPLAPFQDDRVVLEGEWRKPLGRFVSSTLGGHFSREKDYQSFGVNGKVSTDLMRRLLTVTVGGGVSHDTVFPIGGTPIGLSDGTVVRLGSNAKNVSNVLLGASRILNRQWMVAVNGTETFERGYLTEPYKVITVMSGATGQPLSELTDKRPATRNRSSLLFSSVYHLTDDVLYTSYRYYWDTWSVRSHTIDLKYRHDLGDDMYVEPLVRYYQQTAASFFTIGFTQAAPLPDFATSDYRLGALRTITVGGTYGFHLEDIPGEVTIRAQYMRQSGDSSPPNAVGIQRGFDLSPPISIFSVVLGYSFGY